MNEKEKGLSEYDLDYPKYGKINDTALYDENLNHSQRILLIIITKLAQKNGVCFASNSYLANLHNSSNPTITRAIKSLEEFGYIKTKLIKSDTSNSIIRREIYLTEKGGSKMNRGLSEFDDTLYSKMKTPMIKNDEENTISMNIISNNKHSRADEKNDGLINQVVNYLNEKTGKDFKTTTKQTVSLINARVRDGYTLDDFKKVIDTKTNQWKSKPDMNKYLRPQTLFGNKFEAYLQEYSNNNRFNNSNEINKYDW